MKVKNIKVSNFKPIDHQELKLGGASAIVTAANDSGKTSLLKGLIDRIRSKKADDIVKEGEDNGQYRMELTDGAIIEWNFTKKSERLSYTSSEGLEKTSGVIGLLKDKYFGKEFDIDKFLNKGPKAQREQIESIIGLDLSDIEERYKKAYQQRREANKHLKRLESQDITKPEKVDKPDVEKVKQKLKEGREQNEKYKETVEYKSKLDEIRVEVNKKVVGTEFEHLFSDDKAQEVINGIDEPDRVNITRLEDQLDIAQEQLRNYGSYERDLEQYNTWVEDGKKARKKANELDDKVKSIEEEKQEAIANANLPDGFDIDEDRLKYKGFTLNKEQLSQSAIRIAALKIASMAVGEVKTLYFSAAELDNNNLKEIQQWAEDNNLQLLIERPDYSGSDIKYKIIEE